MRGARSCLRVAVNGVHASDVEGAATVMGSSLRHVDSDAVGGQYGLGPGPSFYGPAHLIGHPSQQNHALLPQFPRVVLPLYYEIDMRETKASTIMDFKPS